MKVEKTAVLIIFLCLYLALVGYKVIAYNDNVFEMATWRFGSRPAMAIRPTLTDNSPYAPTKKGLQCRIEHVGGKTMNNKGEGLTMDVKVPCTECNQYIYKNRDSCITYEYDKKRNEYGTENPIMGTCTPAVDMEAQKCPFKTKSKTFKDVYESLPIELVKSVFT
tara:strand:+ start:15 stop:509 length:495 start_codon:yes stop_codon:yes gene_type:complete